MFTHQVSHVRVVQPHAFTCLREVATGVVHYALPLATSVPYCMAPPTAPPATHLMYIDRDRNVAITCLRCVGLNR